MEFIAPRFILAPGQYTIKRAEGLWDSLACKTSAHNWHSIMWRLALKTSVSFCYGQYSFCLWFLFHIAETKKDSNWTNKELHMYSTKKTWDPRCFPVTMMVIIYSNHRAIQLQEGITIKNTAVAVTLCNRLPPRVQFNSRGNSARISTAQPRTVTFWFNSTNFICKSWDWREDEIG